jgi:sortase B
LDTLKAKSIHKSDVELTGDDTILTLSTCSFAFDDARFVVHAKLIKPD